MKPRRFCKNCKHFSLPDDYAVCNLHRIQVINPVWGTTEYEGIVSCYDERHRGECGEQAKYFDPK